MGGVSARARRFASRSLLIESLLVAALFATGALAQPGTQLFTLTPCRVYDSRWGGGPLAGGFDRWLPVGGYCGIPPDASGATFNFTAINPNGTGILSAYPCCSLRSNALVSVKTGKSQAGFGILGLGANGQLGTYLDAPFSTTTDLAVDVTGYFRAPASVQQWQPWEQVLLSPQDFAANGASPYFDVEVDIRFTNPATGVSFLQPAYWEDDDSSPRAFRVEMAFPAGSWSWQVDRCTRNGASCLSGWTPSQGTIQVQSNTATGNPLYDRGFVKQVETIVDGQTVAVSELQFPDRTAFTWVGDTAWTAPPREYPPAEQTAQWNSYLADRKSKGFTAIQLAPAVAWQPADEDSWLPLPAAGGFSFKLADTSACRNLSPVPPIPNAPCWQPVKAYWNHFKNLVRRANQEQMLVAVVGVMNPIGIAVDEPYPNSAGAQAFARYLVGRLGGLDVIYSPSFDDDADALDPGTRQPRRVLMNAVGNELKRLGRPGQPLTVHLSANKSSCADYRAFAADPLRWITHYLFQSGHGGRPDDRSELCAASGTDDVQNAMERARVMPFTLSGYPRPRLPAINAEGPYDSTDYTTHHPNVDIRLRVRHACYLSALSNAVGCTYGAVGLSLWDQPGTNANEPQRYFGLDSATDMANFKANLRGLHLVSHPEWILNNPSPQKYKAALATDETSLVLAYLPGDLREPGDSSAAFVIDLSHLPCFSCPRQGSAPWTVTWLDPRTNSLGIDGGCGGPPGGPWTMTRPACVAQTDCDWLLKLEKTGSCSAFSDSDASSRKAAPAALPVALEAWTDTSGGDGTAAVYAGVWSNSGVRQPVLLSPSGKASQTAPRVSRLASSQIVVWQAEGLDGSLSGIRGALLSVQGQVMGTFNVNHYTENDQREPAVAGSAAGDALVVWSSYGQDGDEGGIFGRLVRNGSLTVDPLRVPLLGEELGIAEVREGHQQNPQVLADAAGYWVAWETLDGNGLSSILSVRRLEANGRPAAPEVRLFAPPGEHRRLLVLEDSTPGAVVVRWLGEDAGGGAARVMQQVVGSQGPLGPAEHGGD